MPFKRNWDGVKEYLRWESDGVWTVEDLNPDDDELAVHYMISNFIKEETMSIRSGIAKNESLIQECKRFWLDVSSERVSLGCYRHRDGKKELAAFNMCTVCCLDDPDEELPEKASPEIRNLLSTVAYITKLADFKKLGINNYLGGAGLFVLPEFRGSRLGAKVLEAREPMCRMLKIPATGTLFTGLASQKLAIRAGFKSLLDISFAQLSDAGFHFPGDQEYVIKMMYIKYY